MPKRIILIAIAALATLAACNSGDINNLYGYATATPGPTGTPVANPSASAAVVTVYASSSPLPNDAVSLYNSAGAYSSARPTGTPIAIQTTTPTGQTTFSNLTPATWYCFQASYQPSPSPAPSTPPLLQTQTACTNLWGTTGVTISF